MYLYVNVGTYITVYCLNIHRKTNFMTSESLYLPPNDILNGTKLDVCYVNNAHPSMALVSSQD